MLHTFPVLYAPLVLVPPGVHMKIDINLHTMKKLVRLLRELADSLEAVYTKDKKPKEKANLSVVSDEDTRVEEIVSHYKQTHRTRGKYLRPQHKDWKLIKKRLKEYTVEQLKIAIDSNAKDDWWVMHNRHGITDILGKEANLEKFVNDDGKGGKNAKGGYSSGSESFGGNDETFGY